LVSTVRKIKTCTYSIIQSDKPIAVIDIDAFKGWRWHKFFRKTFKDIRQKNITNVVIDLRDNGGGQVAFGMNFLSYLIHKPTKLSFDRKPNLMALNFRFKMDIFSRITPLFLCLRFQDIPKNGRLRHYIITLPKKRNAFKGQIYVLTNGKSFSMAGVASTYLKYKSNALIVGEETGGNIAGSNAIINGKFILPHSKICVIVPVYHIYHDIDVNNNGHGLMPDYPTHYTKEQVLKGEDMDLNKVMELVK
jgi:C-terminal processing protease CtpA/Prc